MKIAALLRSAALVTAVALIPATTATMAQVDGRAGPEFAKLFAVFQRVKASYVEPVEDDVLIRGAIDGMLAALDPHSAYLDGGDLQRLETMIDGQYSGLGLSVVMEDGAVKVISPFRGSPAETAGIKAGDFITHLDGKLIVDTKLDDAVAQMRGPKGTSIQLTIFRPGRTEPLEVNVTRGVIELEPVTHEVQAGNIGVITVNEFSADVGADVYNAWTEIKKKSGGRVAARARARSRQPGVPVVRGGRGAVGAGFRGRVRCGRGSGGKEADALCESAGAARKERRARTRFRRVDHGSPEKPQDPVQARHAPFARRPHCQAAGDRSDHRQAVGHFRGG